jgi:hypothetical protein
LLVLSYSNRAIKVVTGSARYVFPTADYKGSPDNSDRGQIKG